MLALTTGNKNLKNINAHRDVKIMRTLFISQHFKRAQDICLQLLPKRKKNDQESFIQIVEPYLSGPV